VLVVVVRVVLVVVLRVVLVVVIVVVVNRLVMPAPLVQCQKPRYQ
jgi:hypothetical protein